MRGIVLRISEKFSKYRSKMEGRDLIDVIVEPVGVEQVRRARPGEADIGTRFVGEIIDGRVDGQPAGDVSFVLLFEGVAVVFHVTRQEDLFIIFRLGDGKPGVFRLAEDDEVLYLFHVFQLDGGVAGMGYVEHVVDALQERVVLVDQLFMRKDAEQLGGQQIFLDAVVIVERRLRPPADVDGAGDVAVGKVKDLCQLLPVGDLFEGHGLDGRAGDDHAVKMLVLDVVKLFIEAL